MRSWMIAVAVLAGAGLFVGSTAVADTDTATVTVEVQSVAELTLEDPEAITLEHDGEGGYQHVGEDPLTAESAFVMAHNYDGHGQVVLEVTEVPADNDLTITIVRIMGGGWDGPALEDEELVSAGFPQTVTISDLHAGQWEGDVDLSATGTLAGTPAGSYDFVVTGTLSAQ